MEQLHIVLLPMIAHGHMIPMVDMAKLFTSRGIKTTIISTPAFADPIRKAQHSGFDIGLTIINFPPQGSDLPDHMVSLDQSTSRDMVPKFIRAVFMLQDSVENLLQEFKPNALVSDTFMPWTVDSAAKFGIPRIVFYGTSNFALCVAGQMRSHKPYKDLSSDSDTFVVPDLPHELVFLRSQVPPFEQTGSEPNAFAKWIEQMMEANCRSYGVVTNSFYELEPDYVDYYRNVLCRKAWNIGPVLLSNSGETNEKALRGKKSTIDAQECLSWLDQKMPESVVYMCFGSTANFSTAQFREQAIGLEASGQDFIWVVRRREGGNEDWLPEGFEERMKGKGLIIRGWAPQVVILDHPAIGAFVTHCGWNSILEGVCAGVPMVTWPVFAEQFYNEKLVTNVLKTGVSVGNKKWERMASEGVSSEAVAKAVKAVMVGEEAGEMRKRAEELKGLARKAIEEGGSSYNDLNKFMEDLCVYKQFQ